MAAPMAAAPILSTPESHILSEVYPPAQIQSISPLSEEDFSMRYEIQRTLYEIRSRKWKRVALQFPDEMLPDAARVFRLLRQGLEHPQFLAPSNTSPNGTNHAPQRQQTETDTQEAEKGVENVKLIDDELPPKLFILADTSYGSCCVDEIAAAHVTADFIVHYGRACLSPTARLPVLHIFTRNAIDLERVVETFRATFHDKNEKIVLAADVLYSDHVQPLYERLQNIEGYTQVVPTALIHDPSSSIPNRSLPSLSAPLSDYFLFHISNPTTALLLTLSSRLRAMYIYPTNLTPSSSSTSPLRQASTTPLLRRRYALVTSLTSNNIWGILLNTLSVRHYASLVGHLRSLISAAGKASYTFVVGKLNAAKLANFAEVGGWVVVGCWESSLVENTGEFWKPVVTPWELVGALEGDLGDAARNLERGGGNERERLWAGEWRGDWSGLVEKMEREERERIDRSNGEDADHEQPDDDEEAARNGDSDDDNDEEESLPPTFDLRTGRYISSPNLIPRSKQKLQRPSSKKKHPSSALLRSSNEKSLSTIRGGYSAGAAFLREKRTWQGLGSDFVREIGYEEDREIQGGEVRDGRSGLARGYVVGDEGSGERT